MRYKHFMIKYKIIKNFINENESKKLIEDAEDQKKIYYLLKDLS